LRRRDFLKYGGAAAGLAGAATLGLPARPARAAGTVSFFTWSAAVDVVKSHITAFEQKTGIKVEYANAPWAQYREAMVSKFVASAPIDTLWVSDNWLPEWAAAGWLQPIDEYKELTKYNADTTDFCNQSMMYKGRQYGLTYYADHMAFYYDDEGLKKAGISAPPQSWDELTQQALKIKKAGIAEYPIMMALARESWLIEFMAAMVYSHGGAFTDDKGNAIMHLPKKGCVEALKWVVDAVNVHKIVSPGCVEIGELAGLKAFTSGAHPFALEPQYRLRTMQDPKQSQIAGRVKQMLMPKGPNGSHATVGWMRFYGLTQHAKKDRQRAADTVKLIEWFGGKADNEYKFQKLLFLDVGAGFGVKSLYNDAEIRTAYNKYADIDLVAKQSGLARKKDIITPWFGEWQETNGSLWQQAILKKMSPEDAMKKSSEVWNKLKKEAG
jgi:multiple sugar transport system substrate-binding protein